MTQGANFLHFWYDAAGKPALVEWNNGTTSEKYAYLHNLQGDIVGIIDSTGVEVVKYTYDAWGKILSTTGTLANTLGKINPFRYRGYVYDEETGLYYLRSRYYNSQTNRFCNCDTLICASSDLKRVNLLSYCGNNPNMFSDHSGKWFGIDDLFTGPVDEIIVLGTLVILSCFGIEPAEKAIDSLWQTFQGSGASSSNETADIAGALGGIAGSYGTYKCVEACDAMGEYLKKMKLHGTIVQIQYPTIPGYIWSVSQDRCISENGFHCGVEYLGVVYCNVHPLGLPYEAWLNDFECVGEPVITLIPF